MQHWALDSFFLFSLNTFLLSTSLCLKKLEQNITLGNIFPLGIVAVSFSLVGADKVFDLINIVGNEAVDDFQIRGEAISASARPMAGELLIS